MKRGADILLCLFITSSLAPCDGLTLEYYNASSGAPPSLPPLAPGEPLHDLPDEPPVELAPSGTFPSDHFLGPLTSNARLLRVRKSVISTSGREYTVADAAGSYLFATQQAGSTHTDLYSGSNGKRLAIIMHKWKFLHWTFKIMSYSPACPEQARFAELGPAGVPLYPHAQLTKWNEFYNHWTLSRYTCNGSLLDVWDIKSRYYFSFLHHFDFCEAGGALVGTMDSVFPSLSEQYNVWITKHEDQTLLVATAILIDMNLNRIAGKSQATVAASGVEPSGGIGIVKEA